MKFAAIAGLTAMWTVACGGEDPLGSEEATALEYANAQEELSVSPTELAATQDVAAYLSPDLVYGGYGPTESDLDLALKGKNKCTEEKQMACDACISNCDGTCSEPGGGGRSGGCVGLFCPTKCDVCQLSCYTSCGKCIPTIYK